MRAQYAVVIDGRRLRVVDFGLVARMSKRSWPFFFVCFFHFWHLIHNCKEKETNKNKGP